MFLAGCGKQENAQRNSDDAAANETSHNALAQLSVSSRACKAKAQWSGATVGCVEAFDHDYEQEAEEELY
jgi:hypothetical protein